MKKFLISSAVAASVFATAGLADLATDGTGQFLVAPAYFANGGFSTKLKLVNTDLTHSVILRGVIREFEASQEIDFIVTLSPSDVWEAKIYTGADGKVYLQSDDDSNYKDGLKTPVNLSGVNSAAGHTARTFEKGYVEFYPMAAYAEGGNAKVEKSVLVTRVDALIGGNNAGATVVGNDMVAGYATVMNDSLQAAMTIPMTAFENVAVAAVPSGANVSYAADTNPSVFVNPTQVYTDLRNTTVTAPFEGNGKNDRIYFTFWGDYTGQNLAGCTQVRSYVPVSRDMEENRNVGAVTIISPAPSAAPNNVMCEFGSVPVSTALELTGSSAFEKGMVQLGGMVNNPALTAQGSATPSFIATNMSAVQVNGLWSFSWVYAPVK